MKERYIQNKVSSILGRLGCKRTIDRMEKDRQTAHIGNIITQEIDRATEEYKRYITKFVHTTLKEQLK